MANLSPRQFELAQLVAAGYTNAEIASILRLSEQTVKNHVHAAYTKLGVHNRVLLSRKIVNLKPEDFSEGKDLSEILCPIKIHLEPDRLR